jgi:hypothetical protein
MRADSRTRKILSGVKGQSSIKKHRVNAVLPLSRAAVIEQDKNFFTFTTEAQSAQRNNFLFVPRSSRDKQKAIRPLGKY